MNVLILAAGVGRRLHPLTDELPKPLLSVGSRTLLDHQLDALAAAGVSPSQITIVGGHGYRRLEERLPPGVRAVYNPHYERWNNIYSITLGDAGSGPTLLVNGDGLYHPRIFALALSHAEDDFLVLDTRKVLGDEEMKVRYRDGALAAIAKTLPAGASDGEYIGMARFAEETFRRVREVAAEMVAQGETGSWYESAIGRVAAERRIGMLDTGGLPWTEVDDHDDLAEAAALAAWGAGAGGR